MTTSGETTTVVDRLRSVVWEPEEPRVRAIYRILIPILLLTIGLTRLAVLLSGVVVPPGSPGVLSVLATGLFEAVLVGAMLVVWARYIDRRRVADYGLSPSPVWMLNLVVALGAVLVGHAAWYVVGSALGWTDVTLVLSASEWAIAPALGRPVRRPRSKYVGPRDGVHRHPGSECGRRAGRLGSDASPGCANGMAASDPAVHAFAH